MINLPAGLADIAPLIRARLLIDGHWVDGDGATIAVTDPFTGLEIDSVANASREQGRAAVDAAFRAGPAWAATSPRRRSEILRRCYELMLQRHDALARLISLESGKALPDARAEVTYAAEFFRWFSEEAVRVDGDFAHAPGGANRMLVQHHPIGVSVLITPWNFPAAMVTRKLAPALAAGCTMVLKPANETPFTALALADIATEAGLPTGIVNVVTTSEPGPVISAMLHDPRVRKLSFTGSTPVGRALLREAADTVVNCSMELGGNAPFIVFDDADLDAALDGAMIAKMRNGGQACTAANRFLVQDGIAEAFTGRLAQRMQQVRMGAGYADGTELGPLINRRAVERIDAAVREAVDAGARVVLGGDAGAGAFYPPTVLADVPLDAGLIREEIFGPVAAISVFTTEAEAIAAANRTDYGLASYIYTADLKRGLRVADSLEAGMVGLNRGAISDPAAPFGGTKQSGLGREGAHHGILEFCETKYVAVEW